MLRITTPRISRVLIIATSSIVYRFDRASGTRSSRPASIDPLPRGFHEPEDPLSDLLALVLLEEVRGLRHDLRLPGRRDRPRRDPPARGARSAGTWRARSSTPEGGMAPRSRPGRRR